MRQATLPQFGEPGCVIGWFDSSQQHTFVNNYHRFCRTYRFTGYVVFIITSFLAGVESEDQCLLNSKVLSRFSGVIMSTISFCLINFVRPGLLACNSTEGGGGGSRFCHPQFYLLKPFQLR